MLAILVLCALGLADLALLFATAFPDGVRLFGHLALSLVGYAASWKIRPIGLRVAVAGVLGPVGLIVAQGLAWRRRLQLPAPVDRDESAGLALPATAARMLDGRIHTPPPESIGPFSTVLAHGDVAARRHALEAVVRSFRPTLSPLIVQALADPDQTIRALAAAAAARVIGNLTEHRTALTVRSQQGDVEAKDALVVLLADHARGNALLSDAQRRAMRQEALVLLASQPMTVVRSRRYEALLAESAWDAGDFATLDALATRAPSHAPHPLGWWNAVQQA